MEASPRMMKTIMDVAALQIFLGLLSLTSAAVLFEELVRRPIGYDSDAEIFLFAIALLGAILVSGLWRVGY